MASSKFQALWNHPAGPKTIHFWAPTFKWVISIANAADFTKPPEQLSYPQQMVVACTGVIWSRYSTIITPACNLGGLVLLKGGAVARGIGVDLVGIRFDKEKDDKFIRDCLQSKYGKRNLNLLCVNAAMAGTGVYQLSRKIRHDYFSETETDAVKE